MEQATAIAAASAKAAAFATVVAFSFSPVHIINAGFPPPGVRQSAYQLVVVFQNLFGSVVPAVDQFAHVVREYIEVVHPKNFG